MITREEFETYEKIRESGETNMFDVRNVIILSEGVLGKESCLEIMRNYDKLREKFKDGS